MQHWFIDQFFFFALLLVFFYSKIYFVNVISFGIYQKIIVSNVTHTYHARAISPLELVLVIERIYKLFDDDLTQLFFLLLFRCFRCCWQKKTLRIIKEKNKILTTRGAILCLRRIITIILTTRCNTSCSFRSCSR